MKNAIKAAWMFYSILILAGSLMLFTLPNDILLNKTPLCDNLSQNGTECHACGLTHGFVKLAEGDIISADSANSGTLPVFAFLLINSIIFTVYLFKISMNSIFLKLKGNKSE